MRNILILLTIILFGLSGRSIGQENHPVDEVLLKEEIDNLKHADSAWRKNDSEFREMRKMGKASETEVHEFAEFVAELKRKVIEGCEAVRRLGGDAREHGVDCIEIMNGYTSEGGIASPDINDLSVPMDESDLYKEELRKLENDFDDMILKAQDELQMKEKVDVASNSSSGTGSGGSGSEVSGRNKNSSQTSSGADGSTESNAESQGDESMGGKEGEPGAGAGDHKPGQAKTFEHHEKGDSRDDDVVARQLREAAEKETDPVLKEQLWKEYEKYKKSQYR